MEVLEYLYDKKQNPDSPIFKYVRVLDIAGFLRSYKYQSILNTCSSLYKSKLIARGSRGEYYITWKGVHFCEVDKYNVKIKNRLKNFNFSEQNIKPKNLIVIYDISEENKKEREWFRNHLKKLNFEMIQKSVWVGPSPIPKEFLEYVKDIGIEKSFKTFKLSKPYK